MAIASRQANAPFAFPQTRVYEKVELAKQEWEVTLDALPQLICLIDENGKVLRANRTVERWQLGLVTEVTGVHLHDLLHPDCSSEGCQVKTFLDQCGHDHRSRSLEIEDAWLARFLLIKAQPTVARQRVVGQKTAIIIQDITQQKQAEESLRKTNEALTKALAARQEMLQNVSHELRTPLTLIEGYASLLAADDMGTLTTDQKEAIAVISVQNQQLHHMIDRLLLLQTLDEKTLQISACHLPSLLQRFLLSWRTRAEQKGVHLLWADGNEESTQALANPDLLEEVINNLLDNAIKFSSAGATVHMHLKATPHEVHIAIADQGIGISPHKQKQIFDHFYQVNGSSTRAVGGMGIGLALCQKIIQAHGGRLWVESPGDGRGSTFTFALPLAQ